MKLAMFATLVSLRCMLQTTTFLTVYAVTMTTCHFNDELVGTSPLLLLGGPNVETSKMQLPFKVWANPRKSALKPRKRDLHEQKLLQLLGTDYDQMWMRKTRDKQAINGLADDMDRKTVRTLRGLVDNNNTSKQDNQMQLPEDLPSQYRELMKNWLIRRATCPIRFVWNDLGQYFWPRWIKHGECVGNIGCSWPPGMTCSPGSAKILNILRWHCRLRKSARKGNKGKNDNKKEEGNDKGEGRRKKRKMYRCMWIKVPYPVPEDCVCSCKSSS